MADTSFFDRIGALWRGSGPAEAQDEPMGKSAAAGEADDMEKAAGPLGSGGVVSVGGYLVVDDKLPAALAGTKKWETYRGLVHDISIVAAGLRLYLNLISKSEWQVQPPEDENGSVLPQAQEIADLVANMMGDHATPWRRIVRKLAMYRPMGFAIMEWTAKKREDGAIGMAAVEHRPQQTINRWDIDEQGNVAGVWQYDTSYKEVYLPRGRLVYAVDDALTDSPEGVGLMRNVVRAALRLKAFEQLEEVGYETDLRGVPVAYAPLEELDKAVTAGTMTTQQRAAYRKPLLDYIRGHIRKKGTGLLLPSEPYRSTGDDKSPSPTRKYAAELLTGDSAAFEPMGKAINRLNQEIARVLGVEHLLLGADGSGSLALSKSKVGTFYLNVTSAQYELAEVLQADWLEPLCRLNGWPEELWPSLAVEEVTDTDIEQVAGVLAKLATAGAVLLPSDPAVGEVYQMLGLTPPPEETTAQLAENTLNPPQPASAVDIPEEEPRPQQVAKRWIVAKRHGGR